MIELVVGCRLSVDRNVNEEPYFQQSKIELESEELLFIYQLIIFDCLSVSFNLSSEEE